MILNKIIINSSKKVNIVEIILPVQCQWMDLYFYQYEQQYLYSRSMSKDEYVMSVCQISFTMIREKKTAKNVHVTNLLHCICIYPVPPGQTVQLNLTAAHCICEVGVWLAFLLLPVHV